jgi:hypothetical protein
LRSLVEEKEKIFVFLMRKKIEVASLGKKITNFAD